MKKLYFVLTLMLGVIASGCNEQKYDAQTYAAMQPCMSMGFEPAQCFAAYQQAGRPAASDNSWLTTVAAFTAGAVAHHWWNSFYRPTPSYAYHPEYMQRPDYYQQNYASDARRSWAAQRFAPQQPQQINGTKYLSQPVPEKNTSQLIPGQQVQPVFKPNVIVENQSVNAQKAATSQSSAQPAQSFKPIQVQPSLAPAQNAPQPTAQTFKPIQTQAPVQSATTAQQTFKPIATQPAANASTFKPAEKPAFKPIQMAPKPTTSSASKSSFKPISVQSKSAARK